MLHSIHKCYDIFRVHVKTFEMLIYMLRTADTNSQFVASKSNLEALTKANRNLKPLKRPSKAKRRTPAHTRMQTLGGFV